MTVSLAAVVSVVSTNLRSNTYRCAGSGVLPELAMEVAVSRFTAWSKGVERNYSCMLAPFVDNGRTALGRHAPVVWEGEYLQKSY